MPNPILWIWHKLFADRNQVKIGGRGNIQVSNSRDARQFQAGGEENIQVNTASSSDGGTQTQIGGKGNKQNIN